MAKSRRAAARKNPARKKPARKPAARNSAARKPAGRKSAARKPAARKPARRAAAGRSAARRTTAKRAPARRKAAPKAASSAPPPLPPGSFIWHELMTPNAAACKSFYGGLFGWKTRDMNMGTMTYSIWTLGGQDHGGMMETSGPGWDGVPPSWMLYVKVNDVDTTARQAATMGGRVMREPADIPGVGRFAVLLDPGGAAIALFKPNM